MLKHLHIFLLINIVLGNDYYQIMRNKEDDATYCIIEKCKTKEIDIVEVFSLLTCEKVDKCIPLIFSDITLKSYYSCLDVEQLDENYLCITQCIVDNSIVFIDENYIVNDNNKDSWNNDIIAVIVMIILLIILIITSLLVRFCRKSNDRLPK